MPLNMNRQIICHVLLLFLLNQINVLHGYCPFGADPKISEKPVVSDVSPSSVKVSWTVINPECNDFFDVKFEDVVVNQTGAGTYAHIGVRFDAGGSTLSANYNYIQYEFGFDFNNTSLYSG